VQESKDSWSDPGAPPANLLRTAYEYDHLGNLSRVTRASGDTANERVVDYAYDGLNRLRTERQYPNWQSPTNPGPALVTEATYDANGNRLTHRDPLNQTTTFGYDALNRLSSIDYSDAGTPDVSYSYDAHGNRLTMQDGTGAHSYEYDALDRLLTATSPSSPSAKTIRYRYDRDGHRTKVVYSDGTAVSYAFDKAGRLESLADWASPARTTGYQYSADGALQRVTHANGAVSDYALDHARRLTQVWHQLGANTIARQTYTLDPLGNRTQLDDVRPLLGAPGPITPERQAATTFGYDRLARLTSVDGAGAPAGATGYAYDPAGNRTTRTRVGTATAYAYDRAHRLTGAGGVGVHGEGPPATSPPAGATRSATTRPTAW
jgi:YD repeat-containing protein